MPPPPASPNPYQVASAQSTSNVETAKAQSILANADEISPNGTVKYTVKEYLDVQITERDTDGNVTGFTTQQIPHYLRTVELSAANQILYDQQQKTSQEMNAAAYEQAKKINGIMSTPFSLDAAPNAGVPPIAPSLTITAPARGALITEIGLADTVAERDRARDLIEDRLQWQIDRDRAAQQLGLQHKGIFTGSLAYEREMLVFDRKVTDMRIQAELQADQKMQNLLAIEKTKADFFNAVQQEDFRQRLLIIDVTNSQSVKKFQVLLEIANFASTLRQHWIQEQITVRSQPMNEISSIMHGTAVQTPQFQPFRPGHISDTPIGQLVYQSAALDLQKWSKQTDISFQKAQMQNQFVGGLMSLGGSLLTAPMTGGGSLLGNWMGGMGG